MKPTVGYTKYGGDGTRHNAIESLQNMSMMGNLKKGIQQEATHPNIVAFVQVK
jgi:hypothetical protein